VPILSAGQREGKNDINARLDHVGLGLDLDTERPTREQIARGIERVIGEPKFRANVDRVQRELLAMRPHETIETEVLRVVGATN
jgi:UDP:flavonoid glycosyltransferase YjiC (YdhE family)